MWVATPSNSSSLSAWGSLSQSSGVQLTRRVTGPGMPALRMLYTIPAGGSGRRGMECIVPATSCTLNTMRMEHTDHLPAAGDRQRRGHSGGGEAAAVGGDEAAVAALLHQGLPRGTLAHHVKYWLHSVAIRVCVVGSLSAVVS